MSGKFVVKSITKISESKIGDELPVSDFSLYTEDDKFIQYEFIRDPEHNEQTIVKPGIYSLKFESNELRLVKSSFNDDPVLDEYSITTEITDKINSFFKKIPVYEKFGIFPKRGILLYGPPGTGKSQTISKVAKEYNKSGDTAIILWSTSDIEARDVKDAIANFSYDGVDKLILVAEDIGGAEYVGAKMVVKASLLSLLDNIEKTFKIPTMILATTNYPENLIEALTDRPQRFDDVIKVSPPPPEFRVKFIEFFTKESVSDEFAKKIIDKKYNKLSVAHLKEVVLRSALYDISLSEALDQIHKQSEKAQKDFAENSKRMGFSIENDDW